MQSNLIRGFHEDEQGKEKAFCNDEWHTGEWMTGYLFVDQNGANYILDTNNDGDDNLRLRSTLINPETKCSALDLPDTTSKQIFVGDILRGNRDHHENFGDIIVRFGEYVDSDSESNGYGFYYYFPKHNYSAGISADYTVVFKIIGNIFNMPDILPEG